jgi:quinol monooxygenase YgiN
VPLPRDGYRMISFNQGDTRMYKKVMIESTVKEGVLDKLLPFLETNLPNVRGFPGCLKVTVFLNKESGEMILDEEWLSVDHHHDYIKFITDNGVLGELSSFLKSPPEIKYLDRMNL